MRNPNRNLGQAVRELGSRCLTPGTRLDSDDDVLFPINGAVAAEPAAPTTATTA